MYQVTPFTVLVGWCYGYGPSFHIGKTCLLRLVLWEGHSSGTEMTLNFHAFQLAAGDPLLLACRMVQNCEGFSKLCWPVHRLAEVLLFSVFLVNTILNNGQSNWLEADGTLGCC